MDKFTKPETLPALTRDAATAIKKRWYELHREWTPDDVSGEYDGPYLEFDRVPHPSCFRRWQVAREAALREKKRRAFVRRCAAWSLSLATCDELERVPLGAVNPN